MAIRPKQSDVARLAGVSRATVSYVLNKRQGGKIPISEQTRAKVLEAAATLGYEPNDLARSLRTGASKTIGIMIPTVKNPHYWDILEGAEEEISINGYHVALEISNLDLNRERQCLQSLFKQRLDGLILMPTYADMYKDELATLKLMKIPMVFTYPVDNMDWVFPNIQQGAEFIMDHLLALGHQKIALIDGTARKTLTQTRVQVYTAKLTQNNIQKNPDYFKNCGPLIDDSYRATNELLDLPDPPTAIWTINDLLAIGTLCAIQARNLRVPDDVAVAGYDDISAAPFLSPPLTTIHMPSREMGKRAAQFLFKRLQDPKAEPMQENLNVSLIIRKSTCSESMVQSP